MSLDRNYFVYIMTNNGNNVLYTGITNNIRRRVEEHVEGKNDGFCKKYKANKLVYYEILHTAEAAIKREKQIKNWKRKWKAELVEKVNPEWRDLKEEIYRK